MADITLSAAVRSSLLSLQNTTDLIDRTQNRLSTGLKVASAIDDPVAFFQAKTLDDRAVDFTEKKDGIDQGISTVSAALEGVEGIENIVRQLKGIAQSMKSATGTQFSDLITQFNNLRTQIGALADDTSYQGTNLINGTGTTLSVSFSEKTASLLNVASVNIRESGLSIGAAATVTAESVGVNYSAQTALSLTAITAAGLATGVIEVTYQGSSRTLIGTGGTAGEIIFDYGTVALTFTIGSATGNTLVLSAGDVLVGSAVGTTAGTFNAGQAYVIGSGGSAVSITANDTSYVIEGSTTSINTVVTKLDSALTTLRTNAQTLGSNVALLQTRLDFTEQYVNTLETGAAKLTLADINEEGANLLALQTRQQLGISALAFAGQAEQGILSLFR